MSSSIVIQGHTLQRLQMLADKSVHMIVTSPPYYGLRAYGTDPQVWGGDPNCEHEWGEVHPPGYRESDTNPGPLQHEGNKGREKLTSNVCSKCGAWRGELGLEPTPEMYIQHLTMIFREARRVLRDDGTLWVNIGDSYAGSWGAQGGVSNLKLPSADVYPSKSPLRKTHGDIKPKDLLEIPSLLAASLRSDGWYLRSRIPWIKRNALPSSVKDRPSSSIEYVFLLSKSKKYYYDYVATMQLSSESYNKDKRPRGVIRQCVNPTSKYPDEGQFAKKEPQKQDLCGNETLVGFNARCVDSGTGLRYMRDSDFFFRTWQGLLHNEDGEPMALIVNPKGYKGAHFACFPIKLVEPMIVAGTSEKGVCPECGAPWVRTIEKKHTTEHTGETETAYSEGSAANRLALLRQTARENGEEFQSCVETTGWQPTCTCGNEPVPATVLDPFAGSCATGVACQWHNRNFIGLELKPEYCALGRKRLEENK